MTKAQLTGEKVCSICMRWGLREVKTLKRGSCLLIKGVIVDKIPGKGLWLGWL